LVPAGIPIGLTGTEAFFRLGIRILPGVMDFEDARRVLGALERHGVRYAVIDED
jgi:hypothetical protein